MKDRIIYNYQVGNKVFKHTTLWEGSKETCPVCLLEKEKKEKKENSRI